MSGSAKYRFVITRIDEDGSEITHEVTLPYESTMRGNVGPLFAGILGRMDASVTGVKDVPYAGEG